MSSLYNLYISQSYQGLIHFASNSASVSTLGLIEDGLGNSLGLYLNNNGDLRTTTSISSSTIEATNLVIKNKIELTGSIDIDGPVTASTAFIENDLIVSGTLFAKEVHTLIESSSIIFSSGSNILGDSVLDTQTLNGTVIMSGSGQLTGSMGITGDLNVLGNISSSTISGIGNVTTYSQSVDSRLDYLEGPFSTSVDFRLDELEAWSSSVQTGFVTTAELTQTASFLQNQIDQKVFTSSYNAFTSSTNNRLNNLETTSASVNISLSNLNTFSASTLTRLNVIETTYATTGSNTFRGTETITGSLIVSASIDPLLIIGDSQFNGRVNGQVFSCSVASQTASFDLSLGNFYTVQLTSGSQTHVSASNVTPGQTISLLVNQATSSFGTISFSSNVKFPQAFPYFASPISGAVDIITFVSYGNTLYGVAVNTMV